MRRKDPRWLEKVTGRSVLIHTRDERTVEGVITAAYEDGVLVGAAKLHGDGPVVPMAGDVFVPRGNIVLVQAP